MPLSKDEKNKLEQAFQVAINLEYADENADSVEAEFDKGMADLLPNLYNLTFSQDAHNYDGKIFNQYKIIKQIGSGGMGDVYLAKRNDGKFDKNVAIKILSNGYTNKSYKDRFLREEQILAKLRHPNIVPLLDAGETVDGIPWFVLEFIDGNPINKFLLLEKISVKETVKIFLKICDALHFAHSKNIIHRDIKPDNILIEKNDNNFNPIILDFGIAHISDYKDLTQQGMSLVRQDTCLQSN